MHAQVLDVQYSSSDGHLMARRVSLFGSLLLCSCLEGYMNTCTILWVKRGLEVTVRCSISHDSCVDAAINVFSLNICHLKCAEDFVISWSIEFE